MISAFQVRSYLQYWLNAVDSHSLHSPFFFDFYSKVVKTESWKSYFDQVELIRQKLLNNPTPIFIRDLGAGSKISRAKERTVKEIARHSLSAARYSRLYSRIIEHYGLHNVLELGTSLGINAAYLASNPDTRVTTFEGDPATASVARSTFEFADRKNISLVEGDLSQTLSDYLSRCDRLDFVFMDANHKYDPTLYYFDQLLRKLHVKSVVVVDDIHYTEEMDYAWNELKTNPLVYGSADLYRCGILFFDPSLNKQHVVLQF